MPSSTIDIEIRARTEALTAELAKAGNLSQKQADKIAKEFVKAGKEAEKANVKAADSTEKHWAGAAKKVASALGEGTIPKFEKLSGIAESFGVMSGASALKVAGLTLGIAALATGAMKLGGTVIDTARNIDTLSQSLTEQQRGALADEIKALRDVQDELTGLDQAATAAQIKLSAAFATSGLAENLAFVIDRASTGLAFLLSAGGQVPNAPSQTAGKTVKQFSVNDLAASIGMPSAPAAGTAVAKAASGRTTSPSGTRAEAERQKEAEREIQQFMLDYYLNADKEREDARLKEAEEEQRLRDEGLAAEKEYRDQQTALAKEAADKQLEHAQRVREGSKQTASNVGSFVGGISDLVSTLYEQAADNAEEGSVREKKARRTAFAVAKAAAIAQAAINTALAVSQALTMVFPLNYINAAIVGALGAAEVGVIAAKQMPTAHSGGMVGSVSTAPDEQPIMALRGEAVLSRQAVQDLGGEQAVSSANRRTSSSDGMVGTFAMVYEHRSYDAFMARDLRRPTGAVRQAIRGSGNAGLIKRSG
jgi:hypothetical protein